MISSLMLLKILFIVEGSIAFIAPVRLLPLDTLEMTLREHEQELSGDDCSEDKRTFTADLLQRVSELLAECSSSKISAED